MPAATTALAALAATTTTTLALPSALTAQATAASRSAGCSTACAQRAAAMVHTGACWGGRRARGRLHLLLHLCQVQRSQPGRWEAGPDCRLDG